MSDTRTPLDFSRRPTDEQQDFLTHTWCNQCQQVDLGMDKPQEYQLKGRHFIEGHCRVCGALVTTELVEEDD
ncbi:MAG: hypothetical protein ACX931_06775 [Saccharospirillum sp.]